MRYRAAAVSVIHAHNERRASLYVLAFIAVVTLALHHEVILGGAIYHMDDAADGYYPCHMAIARAYREGGLPAWERGAATGWPMIADPYYGAFYPLGVLFGIFGAARGLGVQIVLHTVLCAAGMLLLLRRRGLSPVAAGFGAISLALSTFMVCRIRHIIFPEGLAWLTFALAGVEGYVATRARTELVLIAATVGLTLVCGALPLLPFFAIFAALYTVPRLRLVERPLPALAAIAAAALIGLALAGAQLVPTLAHLPLSPRALGTSYAFASSYAWPKLEYLATLIVPDVFGTEERARWFGQFNHWEMAGYHVGLWALLLSPLALLRRRPKLGLEVALLGVAFVLGVGLAFGDDGPFHGWFYRYVPLYSALRCPTRALTMSMLAACVLGAEGLEGLRDRLATQRATRVRTILAAILACVGLGVAWALERTHLFAPLPGVIAPNIVEMRHAFSHMALVLAAGLAVILYGRGARARWLAPLFLLLAAADLFALNRGYVQPKPFEYAEGTDRFQAVDWLIQRQQTTKETDRFALDPRGPFRLHNMGMTYGLQGVTAYSSVQIFRYVNFLEILATGHGLPTPLGSDPAASDVRRFDSPLVDLLNVRWVISDHLPAPGWSERFHPRGDSRAPASRHEPSWDRRLSVWENPHVLPRAFVVYGAEVVASEPLQQAALAHLDPRHVALLEHAPAEALPAIGLIDPTPATILTATRDHLLIEANASQAGILVVSEADYPGWRATVDGTKAELLRVDYALRGVSLPAGVHRVELRYRSRALSAGLLISLMGLLGILGLRVGKARRVAR